MEGHIWIESEGLGKGCTAIFVVKLGIPEHMNEYKLPYMLKMPINHGHTAFPGLKVLVMDENGVSRTVTKELLMHLGCDATTVGSRDECLRLVSHEHKVVFVDISVPGTDGHRITGRIHEKLAKRNERPLIVALTGNTDKLTKENCMRIGMDGLILKPISLDKMRSVLTDLLENRVLFEGI